jgi:BirA family transcriptional regulator, biotin operon repressor / biotin---[acetyl-CoA-carboxylase] ligase
MDTAMPLPLPPDYTLVELDDVDSTNGEAKRLADEGAPHLTAVWARRQRAGRGRRDRLWISPPGNMFWSVILRPAESWPEPSTLPLMTAVAVGRTLEGFLPDPSRLQHKWPNDVLVGGKKISGILIETRPGQRGERPAAAAPSLRWIVVGVGVNVAHHPPDTPYPATDLRSENATHATLESVVTRFGEQFLATLHDWAGPAHALVLSEFRARLRGLGERVRISTGRDTLEGVMEDLAPGGELLLRDAGGRLHRLSAGEVFFPRAGD